MTGSVPNTYLKRLVFFFSERERFVTPFIPVNRIVSMLPQIRTGSGRQPVSFNIIGACGQQKNACYGKNAPDDLMFCVGSKSGVRRISEDP